MEHYGECSQLWLSSRKEQLSKCGLDGATYATEEKHSFSNISQGNTLLWMAGWHIDKTPGQGEEIRVALQTHINDVMLQRYSKARAAANGSVNGLSSNHAKPAPPVDIIEKRVLELSKLLEESENKANQIQDYQGSW